MLGEHQRRIHTVTSLSDSRRQTSLSDLLAPATLAATYFVAAKLSLSMGAVGGVAAPVWPPTGLSLAALLIFGSRLWPGVAAGAFLANWSADVPVLAAVGMGCGNTLEALIGSHLLRRGDFRLSLERLRDVLSLIVLAAGSSTLVSATIGVTSAWLGGVIASADYGTAWWTWWVGDAMGDLVVAPALLIWSAGSGSGRQGARWVEPGGFVIALVVVAMLVFRSGWFLPSGPYPGAYVVFPFVIWAAVRYGQPGVAVTIVVVSVLAIWSTVHGFGPFARASVHESLLFLQTFMATVAATALVLGAVITERHGAEIALRESEERYRRLIEISPDAVTLIAPDGAILLCNEQAAVVQGYTRDELTGRNAIELFAAEDRPRALENLRRTLETEKRDVEYTLLKKDGTAIPVELSASVLLDRTGKPQGFIAVWRDISARKQAEAAAQQLAAIVESSYDAIIGKTLDGAITSWNVAAERMYGYSAAEIIGQPISLLAPAEAAAEIREILAKVKQGERIRDYETVRVQKDGTAIHVSLTVSPIRDVAQNIIGASTIARDISDRRALEQLHADFIASLTHDIRGPVANIGGYLELLRDEQGLSAKAQEIIALMESSVQTTFSLITNYLDQSRIEAGRLLLAKDRVALDELLIRVVRQYEAVAARRDIKMSLQLEPAPAQIEGDALALERVFANLVQNAFKFTPNGGRITMSRWHEDGSVAVSVADTGPGIPADDIPLLFERYQQTATGRFQVGTGLGLFIAKSLVEAHGGKIRVETRDRGSCFTVLLPFMRGDPPGAATSS
jgi:PAS domain S-box-containing protein